MKLYWIHDLLNKSNMQWNFHQFLLIKQRVVITPYNRSLWILTAEGRTPPSAVYKESFPIGIPIPWGHKLPLTNQQHMREREREREREGYQQMCTSVYTWHPRSPRPKILSPSVTTMTWIFFWGQFLRTSWIFPLHRLHIRVNKKGKKHKYNPRQL